MNVSPASPFDDPIPGWTGRLIFDRDNRLPNGAVLLEVYGAPDDYREFIGRKVAVTWSDDPDTEAYVKSLTMNVSFGRQATQSLTKGRNHPVRLDNLEQVSPLESLAGARPENDMEVRLMEPVELACGAIMIRRSPIQIRGSHRCLVRIQQHLADGEFEIGAAAEDSGHYEVVHFNRETGRFDGPRERMKVPQARVDDRGLFRSTNREIEISPVNEQGWYVYGRRNPEGIFVVQALEPRGCLLPKPDRIVLGAKKGRNYIMRENWARTPMRKGTTGSVLVDPGSKSEEDALAEWGEDERYLVIHCFGGTGGEQVNEMLPMGLVTGHFAYGEAALVRDPLSGQPRFEIVHRHVYANNNDGIVSGANLWSNYMGSLERGWMGTRPVSETIIKFRPVTRRYDFDGYIFHPMEVLNRELSEMAARYRVGDGDGSALVGTAESCVQDSNQAMYAAITESEKALRNNPAVVEWIRKNPDDPQLGDLRRLTTFGHTLGRYLTPFGVRKDWLNTAKGLHGVQRTGGLFGSAVRTARTWRTMFPRRAYDHIVELFLNQGAKMWFIRTNQVGGTDPTIWPLAPTTPLHGGDNKPIPKRRKV